VALAVGGLCRRPLRCGHDRRDPAQPSLPRRRARRRRRADRQRRGCAGSGPSSGPL